MAENKIERLLGIIFLLINRDKMTAKELADFFSVSIKTIYRDIETLSLSNIPVISYSGTNGGYGLMKEYIIDKNVFSYKEVVSTLSVLSSISSFFSDPALLVVVEKLVSLISGERKNELKKQANELEFDLSAWGDGGPTQRKLNTIRTALQNHNILTFDYTNRNGESTNRSVEPLKVLFKERAWYLKAYCKIRKDLRVFRLTRIKNLEVSEEVFELKEYMEYISEEGTTKINNNAPFINVLLKIAPEIRVRIEDYIDAERVYEENGTLFAKLNYPEEEYLYNMLLGFGDKIEILEPEHLKDIIKERAKKVYEMYERQL